MGGAQGGREARGRGAVLCYAVTYKRGRACNAFIAYNVRMQQRDTRGTTLTIRNVDAAVKAQLRVRAARHGRSMEAELRAILTDALAGERDREPDLAAAIGRRFAALGDVELEPHPPVAIGPLPTFDP